MFVCFVVWTSLTRGRDIHDYQTRSWEAFHRTAAYERFPSQVVRIINRLSQRIKNGTTPKACKNHLKKCLSKLTFYRADEFFTYDWEAAQFQNWSYSRKLERINWQMNVNLGVYKNCMYQSVHCYLLGCKLLLYLVMPIPFCVCKKDLICIILSNIKL